LSGAFYVLWRKAQEVCESLLDMIVKS